MSTLGKRLKQLRATKKMTQEDLAKELGTTRATVANWEVDRAVPDAYTLQRIADIFHISLDQLLGRKIRYKQQPQQIADPKNKAGYMIDMPPALAQPNHFCLRIQNNALSWAGVYQGDAIIFDRSQTIRSGSLVAVCHQEALPGISVGFYLQEDQEQKLCFAHPDYEDLSIQEGDQLLGSAVQILRNPLSLQTYLEMISQKGNIPQEWLPSIQKSLEAGLNSVKLQEVLDYIAQIRKL